jgi:RNA polymerase sigma-70 factor (ECF subfamily)
VDGAAPVADAEVVARVRAGDGAAFELLMRRHNRRLFRAARAVLADDREAEDVVQDAWVTAFAHLEALEAPAAVGAWLSRIAVHEALARLRRRARFVGLDDGMPEARSEGRDPEQQAGDRQLARALGVAIDGLPLAYRSTFVLRELEGLSTADTAACLGVPEETVKTRLHRARALLRHALRRRAHAVFEDVFPFAGARCDRIVAAVLARLGARAR